MPPSLADTGQKNPKDCEKKKKAKKKREKEKVEDRERMNELYFTRVMEWTKGLLYIQPLPMRD